MGYVTMPLTDVMLIELAKGQGYKFIIKSDNIIGYFKSLNLDLSFASNGTVTIRHPALFNPDSSVFIEVENIMVTHPYVIISL